MNNQEPFIINIGRELGSGGKAIGERPVSASMTKNYLTWQPRKAALTRSSSFAKTKEKAL